MNKVMKYLMILSALVSAVASKCDICLLRRCFSTTSLYSGAEDTVKANKVAIDRTDNILYIIDNKALKAIYLDEKIIKTVPTANPDEIPVFLSVDSGDLYYFYSRSTTVYKYLKNSNEIRTLDFPDDQTPLSLWVYNDTGYFTTFGTGLSFVTGPNKYERIPALEHINVFDVVFDKLGNMFVSSFNKIYRLKVNEDRVFAVASLDYTVTSDINGEIYFIDRFRRVVYHMSLETDHWTIIGAFNEKRSPQQFLFDKYGNVIILTSDKTLLYFKTTGSQCRFSYTGGFSPKIMEVMPTITEEHS